VKEKKTSIKERLKSIKDDVLSLKTKKPGQNPKAQ